MWPLQTIQHKWQWQCDSEDVTVHAHTNVDTSKILFYPFGPFLHTKSLDSVVWTEGVVCCTDCTLLWYWAIWIKLTQLKLAIYEPTLICYFKRTTPRPVHVHGRVHDPMNPLRSQQEFLLPTRLCSKNKNWDRLTISWSTTICDATFWKSVD